MLNRAVATDDIVLDPYSSLENIVAKAYEWDGKDNKFHSASKRSPRPKN